ncbi:MAG: FAD-dependent oxidoreductase [Thermomicrobiales bacterium]|nr:FAD-dependent oxidoreductase [Thermomicrobiales bacterium]
MDTVNLITKHADLVVVGGGLAGTFAAIAAARLGSNVVLIQERPVLGGNSSSEIRVHPVGASQHGYHRDARETGLIEEAFLTVRSRSYGLRQINGRHYPMWDVVLEEMVRAESNLTLHLNTRVIDVETEPTDGGYETRITRLTAVQQGTEAVYEYTPRMVIDATGDGFVALRAGAEFRYGREAQSEFNEMWAPEVADEIVLGSTIMFAARDTGADAPFVAPEWAHKFPDEESLPYRNHEEFHSGYWWLEWGGTTHTIHNNENIRHELQSAVLGVWDHIKNHCTVPGVRERARTWSLDWIGHTPGKRESRRFLGDYFMTEADILRGISTVPDDEVAFGGWPIDLHAPDGVYSRDEPCTQPPLPDVYGIPLGSLYSNTVANLFYAGRNISQSHVAHGSTRVMKTTSVVGEAAGVAAHIALSHDLTPRAAASEAIIEIQQQLLRQGAYLPRLRNTDANDLVQAEGVRFSATSASSLELGLMTSSGAAAWDQAGLSLAESQIFGDADHNATRALGFEVPLAQSIVVSSGRIDRLKLGLRNPSTSPVEVRVSMRQAVHLRDFGDRDASADELYTAVLTIPAGEGVDWIRFDSPLACQPDAPIVIVAASAGPAEWMLTPHEPPGTQAARWDTELGYWRWLHGTFEIALDPLSTPFGPEQIASGVTRPETATNMWISDPARSLPQSLTITWPTPVEVDCLHLTFDSQLSGWIWEGAFPMIAQRYNVEGQTEDGIWSTLVEVTDNVLRRRVHTFTPVTISALRVTILGTHGGATARLVEVRAYGREGR